MSDDAPERVRVTSPRTRARRPRRLSVPSEIDAQTRLGDVYVRSLMRTQLRLALGIVVLLGVTVGALPLVFLLLPGLVEVQVLGVPLPWILLGLAVYPVLIGLGVLFTRRAERNEQRFAELVDPR